MRMNRKNLVLGYFSILIFLEVLKPFKLLRSWSWYPRYMILTSLAFYLATALMFAFPILKLTNRAKNVSKYLPVTSLLIINVLIVYWGYHVYQDWRYLLDVNVIYLILFADPEYYLDLLESYHSYVALFVSVFGFVACYMLETGSKARRIAALLLATPALVVQVLIVITIWKYWGYVEYHSLRTLMPFALMFLVWELPMIEEVLHWKALKSSTKILLTIFVIYFLAFVLFIAQCPEKLYCIGELLPMMMPAFSVAPVRNSRIKYAAPSFPILFLIWVFFSYKEYGWYDTRGIIFGVLMTLLPSVLLLVLPPDTFTTFQVENSGESEMDLSKLPPKKRLKVLRKEYSKISPSELPEEALPVYEELKSMIETANEKVRRKKERKEAVELLESIERKLHKIIELKEEYQSTKNRIISTIKEMTGL